ncbi:HAMP domain-containing protein, partial [Dysosmobacter sp.]|uniref:HAMP domain-containing protein n=1 Tax=Dysosmobacter sp. TaxID=2591382 RepID=UPI002A8E68CF
MAEEEKNQRWKVLRVRGLRKRWIINTVMPVLLLLALIVTLFSAGVSNYYYGTMQKGLEERAKALSSSFNEYFMDNGYAEYYQMAVKSTDSFEERDRIELQFINSAGRIQVSTSGLTAGTSPGTSDIEETIAQNESKGFQGRDPETGESILSVSAPLTFNGKVMGVVRLVTSLRLVNRQIMLAILAIFLIAVLCMALVFISNLLFINNVVEPVAVVSAAAKRISAGSYGVQIENKYTDELGELVDNINDM